MKLSSPHLFGSIQTAMYPENAAAVFSDISLMRRNAVLKIISLKMLFAESADLILNSTALLPLIKSLVTETRLSFLLLKLTDRLSADSMHQEAIESYLFMTALFSLKFFPKLLPVFWIILIHTKSQYIMKLQIQVLCAIFTYVRVNTPVKLWFALLYGKTFPVNLCRFATDFRKNFQILKAL